MTPPGTAHGTAYPLVHAPSLPHLWACNLRHCRCPPRPRHPPSMPPSCPPALTPLEGVAVLLRHRHAGVRGTHVGKDDPALQLGGQPVQVLVVPGGGDGGEDLGREAGGWEEERQDGTWASEVEGAPHGTSKHGSTSAAASVCRVWKQQRKECPSAHRAAAAAAAGNQLKSHSRRAFGRRWARCPRAGTSRCQSRRRSGCHTPAAQRQSRWHHVTAMAAARSHSKD